MTMNCTGYGNHVCIFIVLFRFFYIFIIISCLPFVANKQVQCKPIRDRRKDRRTNIMAIVRRFVLTNAWYSK